ncbi:MAG: hypothetical protein LBN29_08000 [Mediterranea sp.]|nr:hypothetical protein [Mediterranea sp.]
MSAREVNGVYISERQIDLSTDGAVKLPLEGKPIDLGEFTLKLEVLIDGGAYYCSQIFVVAEDTDPNAPIIFTMDSGYEILNGLEQPVDIPFTVDPFMSSVTVEDPAVTGLNVKVVIDKKSGEGIMTLTPGEAFIGGTLKLLVSFGARQDVPVTIVASPFVNGDGTMESPFEINSAELLAKMRFLPDKHFKLTENIDLDGVAWMPIGTEEEMFAGSLDGNGKTISNISISGTTNQALFGYTSSTARISDLTLSGSVTGTQYVAGLVAVNAGTITNCDAQNMDIEGEDYLSGIAAKNTGTISSSTPDNILSFPNFPSLISNITATVTKALNYTPASAVATITQAPEGVDASISGSSLVLAPQSGFVASEMSVRITLGRVSSVEKTIKLFAEEQFDSGDGVSEPFTISKASQFVKIRDYADKKFLLTADIDLSTLESPYTPIPAFSGTLDGGGHTVTGLEYASISTKGGVITANTGNIKNIAFTDVDITATSAFGVIAGDHSVGTIDNVVVKGTLNSTNTSDILGGVAGEITGGQISNVYVNLSIDATCGMIGGIAGRAKTSASTISNCTAEGNIIVRASKTRVAGIVGRGETGVIIKNCLSTVNINAIASGVNGVGGIFGANNNNNMRIEECMFTGKISNVFMSGGIAGVAANISDCLTEGQAATMASVTLTVGGNINTSSAGGIVGTGKLVTKNCIVRNAAFSGVTSAALPISGIASTFQNDGCVRNSVVDNILLNGTNVHGIAGTAPNGSGSHSGNYASATLYYENGVSSGYAPVDDASGLDGGQKENSELTQSFYESLSFDFTNIWKWENNKPVLRNVGYKGTMPI